MKTLALFFVVSFLALFGCSRSNCKPASGDLGAFIIEHSQVFGAHPNTANLPSLQAEWRYNQTSDIAGRKVRISWEGDHISELQTFLLSAFGSPVFPTQTNATGFVVGLYGKDGVAVQFTCENGKDGKRLTRIELQGPQ
jgi:hypothetical protein